MDLRFFGDTATEEWEQPPGGPVDLSQASFTSDMLSNRRFIESGSGATQGPSSREEPPEKDGAVKLEPPRKWQRGRIDREDIELRRAFFGPRREESHAKMDLSGFRPPEALGRVAKMELDLTSSTERGPLALLPAQKIETLEATVCALASSVQRVDELRRELLELEDATYDRFLSMVRSGATTWSESAAVIEAYHTWFVRFDEKLRRARGAAARAEEERQLKRFEELAAQARSRHSITHDQMNDLELGALVREATDSMERIKNEVLLYLRRLEEEEEEEGRV